MPPNADPYLDLIATEVEFFYEQTFLLSTPAQFCSTLRAFVEAAPPVTDLLHLGFINTW